MVVDPDQLTCPSCGTYNERALAGVRLRNPVDCDEIVLLIRCSGCGASYCEVEESGFSHPEGPDYWTRGPLHPELAAMALRRIEECPNPFETHQFFCECPGHRFMTAVMYARLGFHEPGTPWATEEEVRSGLGRSLTKKLRPVFAFAERVHGEQPRDDGSPYLNEHVFPVTLDVANYLKGKVLKPDLEKAVTLALLHDVFEDVAWANPPIELEEVTTVAGDEITQMIRLLSKPGKSPAGGGSKESLSARQAKYMAALGKAPYVAKVVKVFDRLNNLQCVHKNPGKVRNYIEETRRDYLAFAGKVDLGLFKRMARLVKELEDRLAAEAVSGPTEARSGRERRTATRAPSREEADVIKEEIESVASQSGGRVYMHYHSMAWARQKLGVTKRDAEAESSIGDHCGDARLGNAGRQ